MVFITGMGILFILVIVVGAVSCAAGAESYVVDKTFYFLVLSVGEEDASDRAQDVYVNGGAGYVFSLEGAEYVGIASYADEASAAGVRDALAEKGKQTEILPLTVDTFWFSTRGQRAVRAQVEGCVNTLLQCITLLYNAANGLDSGEYTQREVRAAVTELRTVLNGLLRDAAAETKELLRGAARQCLGMMSSAVYAKDLRYLQLYLSEGICSWQNIFCR